MVPPLSRLTLVRKLVAIGLASALFSGSFELLQSAIAQQESSNSPQVPDDRPELGAILCDVTDAEAAPFAPQATEGALVWKLSPDSPAARAGLQAGDVIRMANTKEIKNAGEFIEAFSQINSGQRLDLSIQRGRELRNISLVLAPLGPPAKPQPPAEPPANQSTLPEGLKFSSAAEPLSYKHPGRLFQLQLPPDWAVHARHRGQLDDDRFDTLLERSGKYQVIIWRKSFPVAEENKIQGNMFDFYSRDGLDYPTVGFGENVEGANWNHLSVTHPETGHQVLHTTLAAGQRLLRFEFVASSRAANTQLPEPLRTIRDAIRLSQPPQPTTEKTPQPPVRELPKDLLRLTNVFDGQPRSVEFDLVSGGSSEAIEMEIESPAGAAVTNVRPRSTAAAAGLRRGDLIVQLDNQELNTPEDVEAVIWSRPADKLIPLTYVRRQQRVTTMFKVPAGQGSGSRLSEYRDPTGGYGFRYYPSWRLHPDARREEGGGARVYNYLTSRGQNVQLYLFHDCKAAPDAVASLQNFLEETSQAFLEGYSGWLMADEIPIVFASGLVGRENLQTLYRIAFVVDGQRYEINAFTSPLYDPAQLPAVLTTILGSLEHPK